VLETGTSALNSLWMRPRLSRATSRVDFNCVTEPSFESMVRSILITPLNGSFGMGVKKKLCPEARGEVMATANRTVKERENRDRRLDMLNLTTHTLIDRIRSAELASKDRGSTVYRKMTKA
jgi:hypothetical protein